MGRTSALAVVSRQRDLKTAAVNRAAVWETLHPALQKKVELLQSKTDDRIAQNARWYHELGREYIEIREHPDKYLTAEQKEQGVDPIQLLKEVMVTSESTLSAAVQFAERYTEERLEAALAMRNADHPDYRLHWGHLRFLASVQNEKHRQQFEQRAMVQLLNPDDLHKAIQKILGKRRQGGRPHIIPRTLRAQVGQIRSVSSHWLEKYSSVWQGERNNVYQNVKDTPPDKLDQDVLDELRSVQELMTSMAEAAQKQLRECERAIEHVESAMEANAKPVEPANGRTTVKSRAQKIVDRVRTAAKA